MKSTGEEKNKTFSKIKTQLNNQILALQNEISRLQEENRKMEKVEQKMKDVRAENRRLTKKQKELDDTLEKQRDLLHKHYQDLEALQNNQTEKDVNEKTNLNNFEVEKKQLLDQIDIHQNSRNEAKRRAEAAKADLATIRDKYDALQEKHDDLNKEFEAMKRSLLEELDKSNLSL